MTLRAPDYAATINGQPWSLSDDSGTITLDASAIPHVTATVTVTATDPAAITALDPRDNLRMTLTADGRTFDLGIRSVDPSRSDATASISLASDEALLEDFAQLVDDTTPRQHEASLRAIVNYVLGKIGAQLQPGTVDADMTAYWELTNLLANSSLEVDAANWRDVGNATGLTPVVMSSPVAVAGTKALRFAAGSGSTMAAVAPVAELDDFSVQPGRWYAFSAYVASGNARRARANLQWRNANGTVLVTTVFGSWVNTDATAFRRVIVVGRAPAGCTHALPYVQTDLNAAGNLHYVDAAIFTEGSEIVPYFDASSVIPGYTFEWQDLAHKSASTRIPVVERPPESLIWRAGDSGMAFLAPLVQTAGLRLVCNERREWTLRGVDHREPGALTFRDGVNISDGSETLSRIGSDWYDGAVYVYTWTDADGIEQTRTDAFALSATPSKVIRVDLDTPYPGPGRAEASVRRVQGRGRVLTVTSPAEWIETAEQPLSIVLAGTPIQTGIATRVEFDIAQNTVTVTSRTQDTPASAWSLIPEGEAWNDSPVGESWTEEAL